MRAYTTHPIVLLNSVPLGDLQTALDAGAVPTIGTFEELARTTQWSARTGQKPRIRVGVLAAVGWSGIDLSTIEALAPDLAASGLDIEVWSHVPDLELTERLRSRLAQAVHTIRGSGGRVVGTDIASTYSLVRSGAMGETVRVGVGLFGSTGGGPLEGVRCAIRVEAPVVETRFVRAGAKVGYGQRQMGKDGDLLTIRCGYADGLPKGLASSSDILSIGMQYTVMHASGIPQGAGAVSLLEADSDLDAFAKKAGIGAHELVTGLGNATNDQSTSP